MVPANPSIPLEQGAAAAQAVEQYRAQAVDEVMAAVCERTAAGEDVFGDSGRDDVDALFDYIAGSLIAGEPALFGQYVVWLNELLAARGVPPDSLPRSVDLLRDFFRDRLPSAQFDLVNAVLEGGRRALEQSPALGRGPHSSIDATACHPCTEVLAESLIRGDQRRCEEIVAAATAEHGYVDMAVRLVQPALYRIGEGWQARKVSVAQEQLATALAQRLLVRQLAEATPAAGNGRRALFACVPSNQHVLGARIAADAFELEGWEVDYLGADTPIDSLVERILETQPELVGLSVALIRQLPALKEAVDRIRSACGDAAPRIIAGGAGLDAVPNLAQRLGLDQWHAQPRTALEEYA
ncbi:cobalamin B12-binding domain-containing protein [Aquisalimonas lutea]|uniref:cobalamin B12-binding domain-containing protein n=1 Tax=Aquisalimonas lutea TaxID=1327750 RepID=UPI0025B580B2|nr:cobalamin B12-binding domain-containing protein [Aquisalimonas lutea]MDN3516270.1 cobalamin B12-binding domain-containing protein [Aquisalimonas lutea]